jgi:hypothetical protein
MPAVPLRVHSCNSRKVLPHAAFSMFSFPLTRVIRGQNPASRTPSVTLQWPGSEQTLLQFAMPVLRIA